MARFAAQPRERHGASLLAAIAVVTMFGATRADAATYSYSGVAPRAPVHGLAATITQVAMPRVRSGHVATWVGVGGRGAGPRGQDQWLQVGVAALRKGRPFVYVEVRSGGRYGFRVLRSGVRPGERHRVALDEVAPGRWRVILDGRSLRWETRLGPAAGRTAQVAAETWTRTGACNGLSYRISEITVRDHSSWHPLRRPLPFRDPPLLLTRGGLSYALRSAC